MIGFRLIFAVVAVLLAQSALSENFDGSEDRDLMIRILERQRDPASLLAAYGEMARLNPADSFAACVIITSDGSLVRLIK